MAHASCVDVDEIRIGIVPYSAAMQRHCGVSKLGGGHSRYSNIDGQSLHVQAVPSHTVPVCSEILVGVRGSIATHNLNFPIGMPNRSDYVM